MTTMRDVDIKGAIERGEVVVLPYNPEHVGPASIDLTLSDDFVFVDGQETNGLIEMDRPIPYVGWKGPQYVLPPKSFVLACTVEVITLPADICAKVEGRSSIGRMGLFIQNAGWVDPGWEGRLTLELFNANDYPMIVTAGRRVAQLVLDRLVGPVEHPYAGKYKGDEGTVGSRIYRDYEVSK